MNEQIHRVAPVAKGATAPRTTGITLVEMLVVLAILGVLMAIGWVSLTGARQRALVREGATELAVALQQARTQAQRFNANVTLTLDPGGTSFTLSQTRAGALTSRSVALPAGTVAETPAGGGTSITYFAPFGNTTGDGAAFCVRLAAQPVACDAGTATAPRSTVSVVGLAGKVVVGN